MTGHTHHRLPVKPRPLAWIPTDLVQDYVYLKEKRKAQAIPLFLVEDYVELRKKNPTEYAEILADRVSLDEKIAYKIDAVLV